MRNNHENKMSNTLWEIPMETIDISNHKNHWNINFIQIQENFVLTYWICHFKFKNFDYRFLINNPKNF